jgi:ribosomal protein S18 acetylase RimI-like enzyme
MGLKALQGRGSMRIRPAIADDADKLAQAEYDTAAQQEGLLAARPLEIPVEAFRARIRDLAGAGLYVVMEDNDGAVVGHLLLESLGLAATRHVSQLTVVVHPGHTGRGYGKRLMEHAIDWARCSGVVEKIELRVRSTNPRAIALYQSLGFVREGELKRRVKLQRGYADDICMALFVDE